METIGAARLTDSIAADRAVGTTVARRELAAVLEAGGRPELTLDLVFAGSDERSEVAIEWSPEDLRTVLAETDGDVVTLTFDRDELGGVLDEVEAHGLRTRAAIITVAAVGALGSAATVANAMPTLADTGGAPAGSAAGPAPALVTDASSAGGYGTSAVVADSSSGTMVSDAALGGGYGPAPSSGGETFGIPTPSPTDAILLGGAVLAIAGAAFVSRRPGAAKPA